jgi:glycerol-3-phosphate acyltransferase PlsY
MSLYWLFAFCAASYLFGNISFGVILSKTKFKTDVRKIGSGGTGATNVMRNFGTKWGMIIMFVDIFKGVIPTLVGALCFDGQIGRYACGLSVVVGHGFPVFLGFRGGKGIATTIGAFAVINPISIPIFAACFLFGIYLDYASIAAILYLTIFVIMEMFYEPVVGVYAMLIAFYVLILFMHRKNIYRLLAGKEKYALFAKRRHKIAYDKK